MIDRDGDPRVVEYNCRFGDPEAEVILPIWGGDLYELFHAAATGSIKSVTDPGSSGSAVCVILASGGYPESYPTGLQINGLDEVAGRDDVVVYHAGTKRDGERIITAGGRVLGVTAIGGEDLEATIAAAYDAVASISFEGMVHRTDIGRKGIAARQ
jgi:phosphoribosylamine--glycine ligase